MEQQIEEVRNRKGRNTRKGGGSDCCSPRTAVRGWRYRKDKRSSIDAEQTKKNIGSCTFAVSLSRVCRGLRGTLGSVVSSISTLQRHQRHHRLGPAPRTASFRAAAQGSRCSKPQVPHVKRKQTSAPCRLHTLRCHSRTGCRPSTAGTAARQTYGRQ